MGGESIRPLTQGLNVNPMARFRALSRHADATRKAATVLVATPGQGCAPLWTLA